MATRVPVSMRGKKYVVRVTCAEGTRKYLYGATKADVELAYHEHESKKMRIKAGILSLPPRERTFKELTNKWMEVRAPQKRSGYCDESIIRAHLMPAFGELNISEITAEKVAVFSAELGSTRQAQTVRNVLTLLISMMRQAKEWDWINKVPAIHKPTPVRDPKNFRWIKTDEEVDRFLAAAKKFSEARPRKNGLPEDRWALVYPLYATAIYSGMRAGELAGLRWDDIDFELNKITVQRSYNNPTKTGKIRHIEIFEPLTEILPQWKSQSSSKKLVFPNASGNMWCQGGRVFNDALKKVLLLGGFDTRYIVFHSLRHTFASHFNKNGGKPEVLQATLGHGDSKMSERYTHLAPGAFKEHRDIFVRNKRRQAKSDAAEAPAE